MVAAAALRALLLDAADAQPLTAAALSQVAAADWPALPLAAHPSLRLLPLDWDVTPLWRSLSRDPDALTDAPTDPALKRAKSVIGGPVTAAAL